MFEDQERGHGQVQQLVLSMLKSQQDSEAMLAEENGVAGEFVLEVKRAMQALQERSASESAKYQEAQAQNVRYLQSQREENDRLFASQQQEIESLEKYAFPPFSFRSFLPFSLLSIDSYLTSRKLVQSEQEMQTARQLLAESQQIIKQSIEKPLNATDARDEDIGALRAKVDQLTQENVELAQKVRIEWVNAVLLLLYLFSSLAQ
jgi:hypothetical protein